MPQIIMASAEGEHSVFSNTLDALGSTDNKHRGSVRFNVPNTMFYRWEEAQASNDTWIHVLVAKATGAGNFKVATITTIEVRSISGYLAGFRSYGRDGTFDLQTQTASNTTSSTFLGGGFSYNAQQFIAFDIRIRISTVTNPNDTMTIDYYVEQQLRQTYVQTAAGGWPQPRELILRGADGLAARGEIAYQDIIITDAISTVGMGLVTMAPGTVGFYTDFTNNYTTIDEPGFDFSDLIYSNGVTVRESWVHASPITDMSKRIIGGFVSNIVVQGDTLGVVSDFQPFLRIASTNYAGTDVLADNIAPRSFINVWTQNPATVAPWTPSDLVALQSGVLTV